MGLGQGGREKSGKGRGRGEEGGVADQREVRKLSLIPGYLVTRPKAFSKQIFGLH